MQEKRGSLVASISLAGAIVALALGVAAVAAVGEPSGASSEPVEPVAFAPIAGSVGSTVPPVAALEDVMERLRSDSFASTSIGPAPSDIQRLDPTRVGLPWFYATVRVPSMHNGLDVKPMWEADLVEGVIAEHAGTGRNIRENFGGSTFHASLPNGTVIRDAGGGLGDVARGQRFSTESNANVAASITRLLRKVGLTPISVKVLRPAGPAPAVIAAANDPERAAMELVRITKIVFGDPPRYEGYYFELRDSDGTAIVRMSTSFRTGAGRSWRAPGWEDRVAVKITGRPPR